MIVNGLNPGVSVQFVLCDRPGDGSPEKNCSWLLKFRQPEWKSSSDSSKQCLSVIDVKSLFC